MIRYINQTIIALAVVILGVAEAWGQQQQQTPTVAIDVNGVNGGTLTFYSNADCTGDALDATAIPYSDAATTVYFRAVPNYGKSALDRSGSTATPIEFTAKALSDSYSANARRTGNARQRIVDTTPGPGMGHPLTVSPVTDKQ